mgnify:CR=1 FL=1
MSGDAQGLKGIAAELGRVWGREVRMSAVWAFARRRHDPLPLDPKRYVRKELGLEVIRAWAIRNTRIRRRERRKPPAPQLAFGNKEVGPWG